MKAINTDITKIKNVEVIVNAANGLGPMGYGVAGAIGRAGGPDMRKEVRDICKAGKYEGGDCYISGPGDLSKLGAVAIYHCVTMRYPGSISSLDTVGKAMRATLDLALQNGVKSIAFPGLGTGVGSLDQKSVAAVMVRTARKYSDKIDIVFADINTKFIGFIQQAIRDGESDEQSIRKDGTGPQ